MNPVDQLGMDEAVVMDDELEAALEARQAAREAIAPYRETLQEADTKAKAEVERVVPIGSVVRVGRFRVTRDEVASRHVEFDTETGTRVRIDVGSGDD